MPHEEEILGKAYDSRLMRRLVKYLQPYKWKVVLAIAITVIVSALGPLRPLLTMYAIDNYIMKDDFGGLTLIVAAIVGTFVLQSLILYGQTLLTT